MGASRLHEATPYMRLSYGEWVQVVRETAATAKVVPMTTTTGVPCDCPEMCHQFTVKLADLRES